MVFIFFVLTITFIIQTQVLSVLGLKLDLLLFITIYYGFLYGWKRGAVIGLFLGLLQDIFSGGLFGLAPIGLVSCGILAGYAGRMLLLRYWLVRVGLVFVFTIINLTIYLIAVRIFSEAELLLIFKKEWFITGILNTIIGGIVFLAVDKYG